MGYSDHLALFYFLFMLTCALLMTSSHSEGPPLMPMPVEYMPGAAEYHSDSHPLHGQYDGGPPPFVTHGPHAQPQIMGFPHHTNSPAVLMMNPYGQCPKPPP